MHRVFALALLACLLLTTHQPALAARGDCGQPVSNGSSSVASDALAALLAAVGTAPCGICLCDADGNRSVVASDALAILLKATGQNATVACAACNGAGVSGTVTAPAGTLATGGVTAGDSVLLPVGSTIVELVEISANGVETALLSSTTTDGSGGYSFPTSTGLGSGLLVRALDSGGVPVVSALAVAGTTDIDPASEFVVLSATGTIGSALTADGTPRVSAGINDFTADEYNGCVGQARGVTVAGLPADAAGLVALINAATGGRLAAQIGAYAANNTALDTLTGDYWIFTEGVFIEAVTIPGTIDSTPDLNERLTLASGQTGEATFDGNGALNLGSFTGTDLILSEVSGTQRFSQQGDQKVNATIEILEEQEDEAAVGPGTYALAGDGTGLFRLPDGDLPGVVTQDGSVLGVSVFENDGDSFDRGLGVGFKKASGAGNGLFSGNYHAIDIDAFSEKGGTGFRLFGASTAKSSVSANGTGSVTFMPGAGVDILLAESGAGPFDPPSDPTVTLTEDPFGAEPNEQFTYTVGSDGALTVREGAALFAAGAISDDGSIAALQFYETDSNGNDIIDASHLYQILVRKGSQMSAGAVQGSYVFVGAEILLEAIFQAGTFNGPADSNFRSTGTTSMLGTATLGSGGALSVPVIVANEARLEEISFVTRGDCCPGGQVSDAQVSLFSATEAETGLAGSWSVAPDGSLTLDVEGVTLTGAVSADGSLFVVQGGGDEDDELFRLMLFGVRAN